MENSEKTKAKFSSGGENVERKNAFKREDEEEKKNRNRKKQGSGNEAPTGNCSTGKPRQTKKAKASFSQLAGKNLMSYFPVREIKLYSKKKRKK